MDATHGSRADSASISGEMNVPSTAIRGRLRVLAYVVATLLPLAIAPGAGAQISLSGAVDLALRTHPRVRSAEADVERARAALRETHDAFIPSITAGAGLGQAYGYSTNPPTLFSISAGSLVYNPAQRSYTRSAQAALQSAEYALQDMRESVAQDTALAVLALQHDQQRQEVIQQESADAGVLVNIVQQRLDAGLDTTMALTQARLTAAQFRAALLHAEDDTASDRGRLARMVGVPEQGLTLDSAFPASPVPDDLEPVQVANHPSAAIAAAFAGAEAKQQQAHGDSTFLFRPQLNFFGQYNRYATFSSSYKQLQLTYIDRTSNRSLLTANEWFAGVQISVPIFDRVRTDKAHESIAQASKALYDAQNAERDLIDGQNRSRRALAELQAQAEVAGLQQQYSQQQLEALRLELQNGTGNPTAPQMTPKDEQNARISEREKYLAVVDANYQLHQAQIQLLRQLGHLLSWLHATGALPAAPASRP